MKTKAEVRVFLKRKPFKRLIARNNLTLAEVAEKLGIHPSYVNDLLSHRSSVGVKTRKAILAAFDLTFEEIFVVKG